ncbi:MAG TPA: hypothetical protein VH559_12740 [Gemmatimonadaceae bacterium]
MGKRRAPRTPQNHAEGQHGDKTHNEFIKELAGSEEPDVPHTTDVDEFGRPITGHHRLQEDRQQHDEAEKNSEANRIEKLGG